MARLRRFMSRVLSGWRQCSAKFGNNEFLRVPVVLTKRIHSLRNAHACNDGAELLLALLGPGGAIGRGGGKVPVPAMRHDIGNPGAQRKASGEAQASQC